MVVRAFNGNHELGAASEQSRIRKIHFAGVLRVWYPGDRDFLFTVWVRPIV